MSHPISIAEAAGRLRSGAVTPQDLVEQCLERIDQHEARLHAWVAVDEAGARRAARRAGDEIAAGRHLGPLHGIPVGIKDIVDVAGFPTRAGSPLTETEPKWADAPLVVALRRAGAILLGKTVTCEFACFDPSPTRNPWAPGLDRTPGGSSSGSAVAVATGMCLGAIGTQTGGSLVRPAGYCGVAAWKPTFGRVDAEGVVPCSYHLDHPGAIARTAEDLRCLASCLLGTTWEGRHGWVPLASRQCTGKMPVAPSEERAEATPPRAEGSDRQTPPRTTPPRLGLLTDFFMEEADESIRQVTEAAIEKLRTSGAEVERIELPEGFDRVHRMHRTIMAVEAAAVHRPRFAAHRGGYGPVIAAMLDEGLATSGVDYAEALEYQRAFRRSVDALFEAPTPPDALVMPATNATAPDLSTTGDSKFQAPWSYAGVPVVSIPCALAPDGMPAAIQLVGRRGDDLTLLRVAESCERSLGFRELPAMLG